MSFISSSSESNSLLVKPKVKVSLISAVDHTTEIPYSTVGEKIYFHATPDTSFEVQVRVIFPRNTSHEYQNLFVDLDLDGESVEYSKKVNAIWADQWLLPFKDFTSRLMMDLEGKCSV
jgi:hypothetical protein